jgi:hypothetical protein
MLLLPASTGFASDIPSLTPDTVPALDPRSWSGAPFPSALTASSDPDDDEDEDLGDEEDLAVSQPLADEDSAFDDFDDEFDDDFEEEENDPDWDHPDDGDAEPPPPAKGGGGRKK